MGPIDGLHNVPERFKRCCYSLAPPPTNNNNNIYPGVLCILFDSESCQPNDFTIGGHSIPT